MTVKSVGQGAAPAAIDRGWNSQLRVICALRCGEFGEPECQSVVVDCTPCDGCLAEAYGPRELVPARCPSTQDLFG